MDIKPRRVVTTYAQLLLAAILGLSVAHRSLADRYHPPVPYLEDYQHVPMPPGFGVQHTDVDGPVFVDSRGMTLYTWPVNSLRNGDAGEDRGTAPRCDDTKYTTNDGLMSPYPAGLLLPDLDSRPTCIQVWPPVYAGTDAKPVGKFSILRRKDGRGQWAYDGYPLYTSVLDRRPGDVNGGHTRGRDIDAPVGRVPVGPPPAVPPAFLVRTQANGRLVVLASGYSVYTWDGDARDKSNCDAECLTEWQPVVAGETAVSQGEWDVIERSTGIRQWTFRHQPLYTHLLDRRMRSLEGSDVPGWHNVFAQRNPDPPAEFTVQDTRSGQVLADGRGRTLYVYNCGEDALDQLACDHPTTTQAYRFAICGDGDPVRCNKAWPYALAPLNARSNSRIWGTAWINPQTGHLAEPRAAGAVHVWTFRDRPLYTFAGDSQPGDVNGDAWGEAWGFRNGFKAFWLRDDFTAASYVGGNAD
jgi:predicted lipoprotein with Yx(FWY)xxD motif